MLSSIVFDQMSSSVVFRVPLVSSAEQMSSSIVFLVLSAEQMSSSIVFLVLSAEQISSLIVFLVLSAKQRVLSASDL